MIHQRVLHCVLRSSNYSSKWSSLYFKTSYFVEGCGKILLKNMEKSSGLKNNFCKVSTTATQKANEESITSRMQLVIFDKDGTLICFHSTWRPWAIAIAHKLKHRTGLEVISDVYNFFNYNPKTGLFGKGSLAEKTHDYLQDTLRDILRDDHDMDEDLAKEIIIDTWDKTNLSISATPTCDVKYVFESLKAANIKIAVCTSDDSENARASLEDLGVSHMVDYVLGGRDPHNVPKPAPDNVYLICKELGVDPRHTVMIGDTPADTEMGKNSGVGLNIGVLSGVCDESDLVDADLVLEDVEKAVPFILNPIQRSVSHSHL